jgi:uncharacterized protein (DUF3820 family)
VSAGQSPRELVVRAVDLLNLAATQLGNGPPQATTKGADPSAVDAPSHDEALQMTVPFGRHKGRTLEHVRDTDRGYLEWIASPKFEAKAATGVKLKAAARVVLDGVAPEPNADPPPDPDPRDENVPF